MLFIATNYEYYCSLFINYIIYVIIMLLCTYIGYLCGQCGNGKGVSALLNNCVSCERASILLIIALGR